MTTKFKGWIEKLYVDATGQLVHRGDPLFEIYSPELYSAQVEYLLALNQTVHQRSRQRRRCAKRAANKLKFFDISDAADRRTGKDARADENPAGDRADRRLRDREEWWSRARWWTPA